MTMEDQEVSNEEMSGENEVTKAKKSSKHAKKTSDKQNKKSDCVAYKIRLLDSVQENLEISIAKNDSGQTLFSLLCDKLGGLLECDYFGLRFNDKHGQRQWLDLGRSVKKQLMGAHSNALSFRVKHYPEKPLEDFHQEISQYFLYLQIRRDLVQGRLQCPSSEISELGGLILQAELGDAPEDEHSLEQEPVSRDSSLNSLEVDNKASDYVMLPSPISLENKSLQKPTTIVDFFRNFKIVYNQTEKMEAKISQQYKILRGLTARDAEIEVLKRVSKFETYGVEPFPVQVMHKAKTEETPKKSRVKKEKKSKNSDVTSSTAVSPSLPISTEITTTTTDDKIPMYLGLRTDGLTVFAGLKPNETITWSRINRLACDGKDFFVYVDAEDKKIQQCIYRCENKAAALALWTWTLDRKCFFTLKAASEAKKMKTNTKLFHRSHTHKFIGRSQMELKNIACLPETIHQPDFIRVSSLRHPRSLPETHQKSGTNFSTLPSRAKPNELTKIAKIPDSEARIALTSLLENDPLDDASNALPIEKIGLTSPQNEESAPENAETQICPTTIPQSEFEQPSEILDSVISEPDNDLSVNNEMDESRRRTHEEKKELELRDEESIRAVETIDKALSDHESDCRKVCTETLPNGPLPKKLNSERVLQDEDSHTQIIGVAGATAVFIGIFWFTAVIFALETRSRPDVSGIWPTAAVKIRGLPLIYSFEHYIYSPIRGYLVVGLGRFASIFSRT